MTKKAHAMYYYYLPKPILTIVNPIISPLIRSFRSKSYAKKLNTLNIIRMEGKSIDSNEDLKITVLGNEIEANYYAKLFFEKENYKKTFGETISFKELKSFIENEKETSSLIAIQASESNAKELWKLGFIVIPDEIQHEITIPKDFSVIEDRMIKILATFPINKELDKLTVEQSTDKNDLKLFYDTMYIPTLKKRFDSSGYANPYEELQFFYAHGALFFIRNEGVKKNRDVISSTKDEIKRNSNRRSGWGRINNASRILALYVLSSTTIC